MRASQPSTGENELPKCSHHPAVGRRPTRIAFRDARGGNNHAIRVYAFADTGKVSGWHMV